MKKTLRITKMDFKTSESNIACHIHEIESIFRDGETIKSRAKEDADYRVIITMDKKVPSINLIRSVELNKEYLYINADPYKIRRCIDMDNFSKDNNMDLTNVCKAIFKYLEKQY